MKPSKRIASETHTALHISVSFRLGAWEVRLTMPISKNRNHYLGTCRRTAGNMARKIVNISDDHGLSCRKGMAANALVETDPRACQRSLKRPENELVFLF